MKHATRFCLAFAALSFISSISINSRAEEIPYTETDWLLDATNAWMKPYAIAQETVDEHQARRVNIVDAVFDVAHDAAMPSLFPHEKNDRAVSALFVLAVWRKESHYDLRVQSMHCKGLSKASCDGGLAWCLGQIHIKDVPQLAVLGWSGADLQTDLKKCARATMWRLDAARRACSPYKLEGGDRFSSYASGTCVKGSLMRSRFQLVSDWMMKHPVPTIEIVAKAS